MKNNNNMQSVAMQIIAKETKNLVKDDTNIEAIPEELTGIAVENITIQLSDMVADMKKDLKFKQKVESVATNVFRYYYNQDQLATKANGIVNTVYDIIANSIVIIAGISIMHKRMDSRKLETNWLSSPENHFNRLFDYRQAVNGSPRFDNFSGSTPIVSESYSMNWSVSNAAYTQDFLPLLADVRGNQEVLGMIKEMFNNDIMLRRQNLNDPALRVIHFGLIYGNFGAYKSIQQILAQGSANTLTELQALAKANHDALIVEPYLQEVLDKLGLGWSPAKYIKIEDGQEELQFESGYDFNRDRNAKTWHVVFDGDDLFYNAFCELGQIPLNANNTDKLNEKYYYSIATQLDTDQIINIYTAGLFSNGGGFSYTMPLNTIKHIPVLFAALRSNIALYNIVIACKLMARSVNDSDQLPNNWSLNMISPIKGRVKPNVSTESTYPSFSASEVQELLDDVYDYWVHVNQHNLWLYRLNMPVLSWQFTIALEWSEENPDEFDVGQTSSVPHIEFDTDDQLIDGEAIDTLVECAAVEFLTGLVSKDYLIGSNLDKATEEPSK